MCVHFGLKESAEEVCNTFYQSWVDYYKEKFQVKNVPTVMKNLQIQKIHWPIKTSKIVTMGLMTL